MSEQAPPDDALAEVRRRVDELLNIDIPLMVSRGLVNDQQLFETVGILSLWMRAVMGEVDGQTSAIIDQFVDAIAQTYADDPRSVAAKLHGHMEVAFRENPALMRMRIHLEEAVASVPDDPQVGASRTFLGYSTHPVTTPDIVAYYEILLGVRQSEP